MRQLIAALCLALAATSAHATMSAEDAAKAREKALAENALIVKANAAMASKNWQVAKTALLELVATEPRDWQFQQDLALAEFNLEQYEDAAATFGKSFTLALTAATAKPPDAKAKTSLASLLVNQGNAYLKLKKTAEAKASYTRAITLDPHAATAAFNLCALDYATGDTAGAAKSCDKAIAVNPKNADAYFIKGSVRYADASVGTDGKMTVPDDALKALRKYLELAPNGAHVADVKAMLEAAGRPVTTTYKPKKK